MKSLPSIIVRVPILLCAVLTVSLLIGGCGGEKVTIESRVSTWASIPPVAFVVERIAGDLAGVEILLAPGHSPATYEPTPRETIRLREADIFFSVGMPFEQKLIDKLGSTSDSGPDLVDTRRGIALRPLGSHRHGDAVHEGVPDPHIWLNPENVKRQAATVCSALVSIDPDNAIVYEQNKANLLDDLELLHLTMDSLLRPVQGKRMYVFHPAFGYLADAFGLEQVAIEDDGHEPSPRQLASMIAEARRDGARALFVQPQFSASEVETMAGELGGEVVRLDPLAHDYLNNMKEIARLIAGALAEKPLASGSTGER